MEHVACDVLVLGSGAAGLRAAISAREAGLDTCVVCRATPGKATCTGFSGGVIAGSPEGAPVAAHVENTLLAGRGINRRDLVEALASEAPARLKELSQWGTPGTFVDGYLFVRGRAPVRGESMVRCLLERCRLLGTRFLGKLAVTDLLVEDGGAGILAESEETGDRVAVTAKAVVLAMGGAAALFLRHDNPRRMLGDGWRLALDAGAVLQDLEFVQFYPLGLAEPGCPPILVPPRLADFGHIVNGRGEDILKKYSIFERPAGEKARDRLSQALFREIQKDGDEVHLDLRRVTDDQWASDPFSASSRQSLGERYGALERTLRIAPMAHHTMGGVKIDAHGATTVPGLFAAGEVTGGLHGANRMGGNALTETLVFGARAGASAARWARHRGADTALVLEKLRERAGEGRGCVSSRESAFLLGAILKVMWEDGGIIRDEAGLSQALSAVKRIQDEALALSCEDAEADARREIDPVQAARSAALILEAALRRRESRGAHFREDFPAQDDADWQGHLEVERNAAGGEVWRFRREEAPSD